MSTETSLRKPFIAALRKCGAIVIPYVGSSYGQSGVSDVFVAHLNWHGWIEFKGPKTVIQPIQMKFIDDMRKREVNALIIRLFDGYYYRINEEEQLFFYRCGNDIIGSLWGYDLLKD